MGKYWSILPEKIMVIIFTILVFGNGVSKLLNVLKFESKTGEVMSNAITESLFDWSIVDRVQSLLFKTTASNKYSAHKWSI